MPASKVDRVSIGAARTPLERDYRAGIEALLDQADSEMLADLWREACPFPVDELPPRHAVIEDLADFAEQLQPRLAGVQADELCRLIAKYAARRRREGNPRARVDRGRDALAREDAGR